MNKLCISLLLPLLAISTAMADPWKLHTIDDSSRGADGARMADVNGDGLLDIATGWEEGGIIRVYLNPGPKKASKAWPAVTVGKVKSPEDAVFADLDGDGAMDVISSCEGSTRTMYVHWAPRDLKKYLDPNAWTTEAIPCTEKKQSWMFALPMQIDGQHGVDLIVGSKSKGATVGWLQAPSNARELDKWKFHSLYQAGWIMSLDPLDVDADGDLDVVVSDRKGANRGLLWLENPGAKNAVGGDWAEHRIGAEKHEVMFLDVADFDGDGLTDIISAGRNKKILFAKRKQSNDWEILEIPNPMDVQNGKSVRVADVDLDGKLDLVHDANTYGNRSASGVVWMSWDKSIPEGPWQVYDISGKRGVKYDLIQMIDLDGDGDLDFISCEERDNLGVFWYENPTR